jgi:serine/threonine protein phosphatase PrpC
MQIETVAKTAVGPARDHNEDAVYAGTIGESTILAVADGMGGHRAGDVASEEALDTFVEHVGAISEDGTAETLPENILETVGVTNAFGADTTNTPATEALTAAVSSANTHLQELVDDDPELDGMGTTLVAALVGDESTTVVNVGDSRAYHVTDEDIEQVTTDQSLVQELVDNGTIDPEEADDHPQKNVLSQALGTAETVDPDIYQLDTRGTLLLCSDGLSDEVSESTIQKIVTTAASLEQAGEQLIERAVEVDGSDNVSVVLGRSQ